jgi:electron transfer flavoprotein alpha subunit
VSNGYLFEDLSIATGTPPIICFLPSVLGAVESGSPRTIEVEKKGLDGVCIETKTHISKRIKTDVTELDLSEAGVVVAGGRGLCEDGQFERLHQLADLLGGPVGGTRPAVDMGFLNYERQIGQTGKTIAPDLLINCGISGANEYTAGIEKSKSVVAINSDERARIFNFADLCVVGDAQEILPLVIELLKEKKTS